MSSEQSNTLPPEVQITVEGGYVAKIGRIDSAFLGIEDHGMFTIDLGFDFGGTHQGLGHIGLGWPEKDMDARGLLFLLRLVQVVGPLTSCIGGRVLVLYEPDGGWNAPIKGLMPLIGGRPVIFDEVFR